MPEPLLDNRYEIQDYLAEGGFGKTFLAIDTKLPSRPRRVIKQLKPVGVGGASSPENHVLFSLIQQRFNLEAAVLESVGKHDQIPDLYAYFSQDGLFYLVQEWIEGKPLSTMLQDDWSEDRVRKLLVNALNALAHVHSKNLIHRDIKPDNIILRQDKAQKELPCLIDFGAVKQLMSTVVSTSSQQQQYSMVIGTPGFMPLEQLAGRPTFSSDLHALGITAICLLTGRLPAEIPSDNVQGKLLWQQYAPGLSNGLAEILSKAVDPYAPNRYPTAPDMLAALTALPTAKASEAKASEAKKSASSSYTTELSVQPSSGKSNLAGTEIQGGSGGQQVKNDSEPTVINPLPPYIHKDQALPKPDPSPSKVFPWKRLGIAAGAVAVVAVAWVIRPQPSSQGWFSSSQPQDFPALIASLEETVQKNPNDAEALLELANAYREVGDYGSAQAQFSELLLLDPENAAALLGLGKVQIALGDFSGAFKTLEQSALADPSNAETLNVQGDALFYEGQYEAAAAHYSKALEVDPDSALAYVNLSFVDEVQGNPIERGQNLYLAVTKDPNFIQAYLSRGLYRYEQSDVAGAEEDLQAAIALPATTAEHYTYQGVAHRNLGQGEEAIKSFNQALAINPNYLQSYIGRAGVLDDRGDVTQALIELDKALAINPNDTSVLNYKGYILATRTDADWQDSVDVYSQALVVNPNDPFVLQNRCDALLALGNLDLALADCSQGLATNPNSASLHESTGAVRVARNDYAGAVKDFTRSLEITDGNGSDPSYQANAYASRAYAFLQLGTLDKARADIDQAMTLVVDDANVYYTRGLILVKQGDKASGAEDLRKAAELYLQAGDTDSQQGVLEEIKTLGI